MSTASKDSAPIPEPNLIGNPIAGRPGHFSSGPDDGAHLLPTATHRPSPPDDDKLFVKVAPGVWKQEEGN